ncbi:hypothetical protein D3C85_1898930 [compost metagenome]
MPGEALLGSFHELGLGDIPLEHHQRLIETLIGGDGDTAQQYQRQKITFEHDVYSL